MYHFCLILTFVCFLGNDIIQVFRDMAQHFQTRGWFKGLGGELMKQAFAKFIRTCSIVRFPIHSTKVVGMFFNKTKLFIFQKAILKIYFQFCQQKKL